MIGNSGRGLYTVIEAARLLGVGRSTMYELVRRGRGAVAAFGPQGVDHQADVGGVARLRAADASRAGG
jgi:excisionase family DNA binding protein